MMSDKNMLDMRDLLSWDGFNRLSKLSAPAHSIAKAFMETDPAHDMGHIFRVTRNALLITEGMAVDYDVLIPASILHDVVNAPKDDLSHRKAASRRSAEMAASQLRMMVESDPTLFEVFQEREAAIRHAIHAHSFSAGIKAETLEAQAVQDADRLDALGYIGIARCISVSGKIAKHLFDQNDPGADGRPLDGWTYGLDHFPEKLYGLADTMHLPKSRELAQEKLSVMKMFRDNLCLEILGV